LKNSILFLFYLLFSGALTAAPIDYWNTPRRGTNFFNKIETPARFAQAKKEGIQIVRLVFNKWASAAPNAKDGDFLVGSTDEYRGLVEKDLKRLRETLDWADAQGIKIILSTLSLPGARWRQQNENQLDSRLWQNFRYHEMAARFWRDLARGLKGHPAIVAFNLINEPYPEAVPPKFEDWYTGDYESWAKRVGETPADLNAFNARVISAIREVDADVPVVVDVGFYSTPFAFKALRPLDDKKVLYSFHMYEPYAYTSYQNKKPYTYPGQVPIGEAKTPPVLAWNASTFSDFFAPVRDWQKKHAVASNRILAGEFGTYRRKPGAETYLSDLIELFEREHWHWAFYSFREDTWEGMDYELGKFALPAEYWEAEAKGIDLRSKYYNANPLMNVLRRALTSSGR